jgi:hypothetical protein
MFPLPGYPANVDIHPSHMGAPKHFKDIGPQWTVNITYLWTQTFPTHRNVHVHHEYAPFPASGAAVIEVLREGASSDDDRQRADLYDALNESLLQALSARLSGKRKSLS